jgi:hypothetical protein
VADADVGERYFLALREEDGRLVEVDGTSFPFRVVDRSSSDARDFFAALEVASEAYDEDELPLVAIATLAGTIAAVGLALIAGRARDGRSSRG